MLKDVAPDILRGDNVQANMKSQVQIQEDLMFLSGYLTKENTEAFFEVFVQQQKDEDRLISLLTGTSKYRTLLTRSPGMSDVCETSCSCLRKRTQVFRGDRCS